MEQYEEENCSFRVLMHDLSIDKSGTSEAIRSFATVGDPAVEMGTSHYGFHLGFTDH